jgi:hypothetical protein
LTAVTAAVVAICAMELGGRSFVYRYRCERKVDGVNCEEMVGESEGQRPVGRSRAR